MHVSIAIVGFRNTGDITQCLNALSISTHMDFEVVVCENGGDAAYSELLAAAPSVLPGGQVVRVINAGANLGYAGGVNVCIRESPSAEAWWVLNPDTIPKPNALEEMLKRLARGDCQAVGCAVHLASGRIQSYGGLWSRFFARAVSIGHGSPISRAVDPQFVERVQNYLNGASMLMGRRFLQATGYMCEDYFLYCEEVEWCLRAVSKGMRLGFANEAIVVHQQGTTTGAGEILSRRRPMPVYLSERNKILLTRDRFPWLLPIAAPAALIQMCIRGARYRAWRQLRIGVAGWVSGLLNERGLPDWARRGLS